MKTNEGDTQWLKHRIGGNVELLFTKTIANVSLTNKNKIE